MSSAAAYGNRGEKRSHLREMGLPTLFGAIVLLVSATLLLGANITALRGNLDWMAHSQKVLTELAKLEAALLSDEMTVRGYALTRDPRFLRFERQENQRCHEALAALAVLMDKEPHRKAQFLQFRSDIDWHMQKFSSLIAAERDTSGAVVAALFNPDVRTNMKRTRAGVASLRNGELDDLAARQADITDQLTRAFFLAAGIIIAAFVLGGVGVWAALQKCPPRG